MQDWRVKNDGIPIIVIRRKNLYQDLLNAVNSGGRRFSSIPAYTAGEANEPPGMLMRQCTGEYKVEQVDAAIRSYLELETLRGQTVEVWKGITLDEIERMSIPSQRWKIHVYPFCGYKVDRDGGKRHEYNGMRGLSRTGVIAYYKQKNLPVPPKSSCVFCPYQSDASWIDMKTNNPEDWEAACLVDEAIRNSSKKGVDNPIYLHESLIPLREVKFPKRSSDLWHGECSGECHT